MPRIGFFVLVTVVASLPAARSLAESAVQPLDQVSKVRVGPSSPQAAVQMTLAIEPSFWDTFGVTISRNGNRIGPEFLSVIPDEELRGSPEAMRHAAHARIYQGLAVGFGAVGVGLLGAGVGVRSSTDEWTTGSRSLIAGGIVGILAQAIMAVSRQNELGAAVTSYNADLLRGTGSD